jgi:parallel beta-helix repeat protein
MNKKQNILFLLFALLISSFYLSYSLLLPAVLNNPVVSKLNLPSSSTQVAALEGTGSGLVGWWKFDEGSGNTAADSSGNGNNGTLQNIPSDSSGWVEGKLGTALKFNPGNVVSTSSVTMSKIAGLTGSKSVSVWIMRTGDIPTFYVPIVEQGGNPYFRLIYYSSRICFGYDSVTPNFYCALSAAISGQTNKWLHVVAVYDGSAAHIFFNGYEQEIDQHMNLYGSWGTSGLAIGWRKYASDVGGWNGLIDDVRIYDRNLSASEIVELYNQGQSSGAPPPTDTTPPARTGGSPSGTFPAGTTQVTLRLNTDENATCKYGTTAQTTYGSISTAFGTTGGTAHSATITGLQDGRSYSYYVRCEDSSHNVNTDDSVITFSVNTSADIIPPSILAVTAGNITTTGAVVTWTTNESSDSQVEYGPTITYGSQTAIDSNLTTSHSVTLGGLTAGTAYHFRVKSKDSVGNIASSTDRAFSTQVDSPQPTNEYHVSISTGNDTNPGTVASPFKTIQKCADVAKAGYTCIVHTGTYREAVSVKNSGTAGSPVTFTGAPGETAIITGSDQVTNWTPYSGSIYVANVGNITAPTQLYVDGSFYDIARYPNSGWLSATTNSTDMTTIIDSDLSLPADQIVGASVLVKAVPWHISTLVASSYDSSTHKITLSSNVYGNDRVMRVKYGFYLQNKLWMLDQPGEWLYDSSAGKVYLWSPNSDNPNNHDVEISRRTYGIYDNGKNYVTIKNLTFTNANQDNVIVGGNTNNVIIDNLHISGGVMGIDVGMSDSVIRNNSVRNTISNGIQLTYSVSNIDVSNNTIDNAGNTGTSPKQANAGIFVGSGININIAGNTITNSGYVGILFYGDRMIVQDNHIDRSCLILDDCGGIYTNSMDHPNWTSTIRNNVVKNSIGNWDGTPGTGSQAEGIYLDDYSHGYTVSNNVVYNAGDIGIFIHTGYNNLITGNSVYGSKKYGFLINESSTGMTPGVVHDNIVTNNKFETIANGPTANYYSGIENSTNFGTYNNNQYCHPNADFVIMNQNKKYSLVDWQKFSGQDLNSTDTKSYCDQTPISSVIPPSIPSNSTPDTTPPTVSSSLTSGLASNGATISFTTSEPSTTQVEYGQTASYGNLTTLDSSLTTIHTVTISNLNPNTAYHYRVITKDNSNNQTISGDQAFTTLQGGAAPVTVIPTVPISTPIAPVVQDTQPAITAVVPSKTITSTSNIVNPYIPKTNTTKLSTKPKTSTFKPITNLDNSLLTIPTTTIDITVPKVPSWIEVLIALFKEIVNRIKMGAGRTVKEIGGLF